MTGKSQQRKTRACHGTHALPYTRADRASQKKRGRIGSQSAEEATSATDRVAEGQGGPIGGYRENEARPYVPDGPLNRHEVRRGSPRLRDAAKRKGERERQVGPRPQGSHSGPVLTTETTIGASLTRD